MKLITKEEAMATAQRVRAAVGIDSIVSMLGIVSIGVVFALLITGALVLVAEISWLIVTKVAGGSL